MTDTYYDPRNDYDPNDSEFVYVDFGQELPDVSLWSKIRNIYWVLMYQETFYYTSSSFKNMHLVKEYLEATKVPHFWNNDRSRIYFTGEKNKLSIQLRWH